MTLPPEALSNEYYGLDDYTQLRLVSDRRAAHIFYYIRAILEDGRRPHVATLGTDLPLSTFDGYGLAVELENERRRVLAVANSLVPSE